MDLNWSSSNPQEAALFSEDIPGPEMVLATMQKNNAERKKTMLKEEKQRRTIRVGRPICSHPSRQTQKATSFLNSTNTDGSISSKSTNTEAISPQSKSLMWIQVESKGLQYTITNT